MSEHDDPVDTVILSFLDYLEGTEPRPSLDHLSDEDRALASTYLDGMAVARGLDPAASRPSIEVLLAGTALSSLVGAVAVADVRASDLATVRAVLADVDPRVRVTLVESPDANVLLSYLDLRARFVIVPGAVPIVTGHVRSLVARLFSADPDTSRIGVVAGHSEDLTTQLLAAEEMGSTITTPLGEPHLDWDRPLSLTMAARRMLDQSVPEWPAFDFDTAHIEALDVTSLAVEIARRAIARESGRSYRGDKRRAYQALVGQEDLFADLVTKVTEPGSDLNLDDEVARIAGVAA